MKTGFVPTSTIIFLIIFNFVSYGQEVPFLTFPVSSLNAGMGSVGTSLSTNDSYGFLYNPALLGYTSQFKNFSFQMYVQKPIIGKKHFNYHVPPIINSFALNLGYNLTPLIKFPLIVGFGYSNPELSYYPYPYDLQPVYEKNEYKAYSVGVGLNYCVNFSVGFTYKSIAAELPRLYGESIRLKSVDGGSGIGAYDIGILINVPIWKLIENDSGNKIFKRLPVIPNLDFTIGYTQSNIGDKVYYLDRAQADALPREARLGYSISGGIRMPKEVYDIELFNFDFSAEAEDYLFVRDSTGNYEPYQKFLGDINIFRNIFGIKGDDNVYSHTGLKVGFLETAEFMWGHIGSRQNLLKTDGFTVRLKGFLKFLTDQRQNPVTNFIADHFDIRYYYSDYLIDYPQETIYKGIEVVFSDFTFD